MISSFSNEERDFYEREFSFFGEVTGVSGKLRPYIKRSKPEKKEKIEKKVSDVEMADATRPGPSIQSTIDKAVDGKLRNLTAELKKASRPVKSRLTPLINELRFPDQARVREDEEGKVAFSAGTGGARCYGKQGQSRRAVYPDVG